DRQAAHVERVCNDDAIEAEIVTQQFINYLRRERAGQRRVFDDDLFVSVSTSLPVLAWRDRGRLDLRQTDVPRHDRADACGNRRAEWYEFNRVEPRARHVDDGQAAMRVNGRVAMTGKMFGSGDDARALRALDEGCAHRGDCLRVFAVRAHVDDRVRGVVVDINHRREDLRDAERTRL